ncbi:MAG: hypothetical protein EA001_08210 [Oscillatoriales cyanobacterium]|nr:MAG: hypothetical protein EA001_08210 [Oscillatoriales cyanobacterium]
MRLYRSHVPLSLIALALVYQAMSWVVLMAHPQPNSLVWVSLGGIAVAVLLAAAFAFKLPWPMLGKLRWLQTATRSFGVAIAAAMAVVIVLSRLDITADVSLVLTAEFLAKLELRVAGRSRWQSFWQLLGASVMGISLSLALAPALLMSSAGAAGVE